MFTEERQNAIEKMFREKGKVRVKELSEMFQVTGGLYPQGSQDPENAGRLKQDLRRSDLVTGVSSGEKRSRQAYAAILIRRK